MKPNKAFYIYIASAVIIYILIYIPAYHIPFHSDDYLFYLRGISLEALFKHYMNWEGRLVGDYTGALLLHFFSRPAYMAINALVFLIVIVQISLVPSVINRNSVIDNSNVVLLWLAFFLYWLCNPCLGQTSFWIIGSVIYMWPLMWAGFYILCLVKLLHNSILDTEATGYSNSLSIQLQKKESEKIKEVVLLGVLGFLAGLSNEATGATVVFFTIILLLFFSYAGHAKQSWGSALNICRRKEVLLTGFLSTLTGFLILVLAPGNFIRMKWIEFADWQNLSLTGKILFHILGRFPLAISRFWLAFFIIAVLLLVLVNTLQAKYSFLKSGCYIVAGLFIVTAVFSVLFPVQFQYECLMFLIAFITYAVIAYILIKILQSESFVKVSCQIIAHYGITVMFFVMAVFSILIFILSPYMPQRTLNTFNFYIVLTIIMLVDRVFRQFSDSGKLYYYISFLFLVCVPYFVISHSRFTYAVMQTKIQATIRDEIIADAKIHHSKQAEIPDWYFTKLGKSTDKFDLFRSDAMPAYYGIKHIAWNPAYFNYAILKSGKPIIENLQVKERIKTTIFYNNSCRFFDDPSLVFGFINLPLSLVTNNNGKICFALHMKDNHSAFEKTMVLEEHLGKFTKIGNCYYIAVRINENIQINDIKRIDIDFCAQETGKLLFSFPICLIK